MGEINQIIKANMQSRGENDSISGLNVPLRLWSHCAKPPATGDVIIGGARELQFDLTLYLSNYALLNKISGIIRSGETLKASQKFHMSSANLRI